MTLKQTVTTDATEELREVYYWRAEEDLVASWRAGSATETIVIASPTMCSAASRRRGTKGAWRLGDCPKLRVKNREFVPRVDGSKDSVRLLGIATIGLLMQQARERPVRLCAPSGDRALVEGYGSPCAQDQEPVTLDVSFDEKGRASVGSASSSTKGWSVRFELVYDTAPTEADLPIALPLPQATGPTRAPGPRSDPK